MIKYLGKGDDAIIMNIGKMSKLSTQSMRPHYEVGRGSSSDDRVYTVVADMMQRTFTIKNQQDEVVAQVAKTVKALIQTAAFGSGSESTIDIAPGVDCSTILAIVYGIGQVGSHFGSHQRFSRWRCGEYCWIGRVGCVVHEIEQPSGAIKSKGCGISELLQQHIQVMERMVVDGRCCEVKTR
jgi:hypothetical protein